jgi:hypothetical protein
MPKKSKLKYIEITSGPPIKKNGSLMLKKKKNVGTTRLKEKRDEYAILLTVLK